MANIGHNKKHGVDSTTDHTGVSGAVENNLVSFNGSGLAKDSNVASSTVTANTTAIALNTTHRGLVNPHTGSAASGANTDITGLTGLTGNISSINVAKFNIAPTNASPVEGDVWWNPDDHTLNVQTSSTPILQVGQEIYIFGKDNTGSGLSNGNLVLISGASGNRPKYDLAKADAEVTSKGTIAMITHTIGASSNGYGTCVGLVRGLNTNVDSEGTAVAEGDGIYLSATVLGGWSVTQPLSPNHLVAVGYVVRKHGEEGIIFIKIQNGWEMEELHNVDETIPSVTGQILAWNNTNSKYELSTHINDSGASHTYIDQSVVSGATPTFTGTNFTGILDTGILVHGSTETLREYLVDITVNGYLDITTVTDAGGLDLSWIAGNGAYVDGSILNMTTSGSPYTLDDNAISYMYATVAGSTTFQISTTPPTGEFATRATIYTEGGDIIKITEESAIRNLSKANHDNLDELHSEIVVSGMDAVIDADGTNANDFTVATGVFYIHAHERETNDSMFYSAGVGHAESKIERYYHASSVWAEEDANGVDFGFWDNGTDKTAVSNVKWYCAFIYWESDSVDRADYVYPQVEHASESAALAEALTYPPYHQGAVIPISQFIFRGDQSAFGAKAYLNDIRPTHGGGSGASGVNQNVFQTISSDSGSTTADSATDTLTFSGGTGILTSISGDIVTITGDAASLTAAGIQENANTAEIDTPISDTLTVTPNQLNHSDFGIKYVQVVVTNYNTVVTTGDGQAYFHIPAGLDGYDLVEVHAKNITAGTTGTQDIQIYNVTQAADMLSTPITIDSTETGSDTAATPAVIDTDNDDVAENDLIRIDNDAIHTTPAEGEIVTLGFRKP